MQKLRSGEYRFRVHEIASSFTIKDTTALVELVKDTSMQSNIRFTAMNLLQQFNNKHILHQIKKLERYLLNAVLKDVKEENEQKWRNRQYAINNITNNILWYKAITTVGKLADKSTIQFLIKEFEKDGWENHKPRDMSEDKYDAHFRLQVFKALGEAAVTNPELFPYLESLKDKTKGPLKKNISSLLPNYKEKYFQQNPSAIPTRGYVLMDSQGIDKDIFDMHFCIREFYNKKRMLPHSLKDVLIVNGGQSLYIKGDMYSQSETKFFTYKCLSGKKNGIVYWTYILLSVGPNGKLDTDLSKLQLGMTNAKAQKVLGKKGNDDIFEVEIVKVLTKN